MASYNSKNNNSKKYSDEEWEDLLARRRQSIKDGTYESHSGVSLESLQKAQNNSYKDTAISLGGGTSYSDYQESHGYNNGADPTVTIKSNANTTEESGGSLWERMLNAYNDYKAGIQQTADENRAKAGAYYLSQTQDESETRKAQAENMTSSQLKNKVNTLKMELSNTEHTLDTWSGSKYDGSYAQTAKKYRELQEELSDYEDSTYLPELEEQYKGLSDEDKALLSEYTEKFNTASNTVQDAYTDMSALDYSSVAKEFTARTGLSNVAELAQYNDRITDKEEYEKEVAEAKEYASEHPVLATAKSVGQNLAGGYAASLNRLDYILNGDKKQPYNAYDEMSRQSNLASDTRQEVSDDINSYWKAKGNSAAGSALSFLYNTGTSIADSASAIALGGGTEALTLGTMSLAMQAQQERESADNGATGMQSVLTGLAAGIAEGVFEKIPLDNMYKLFENATSGVVSGVKGIVKSILKQANIEGLEEVGTDVANFITDNLINGDKSSFNTAVQNYINRGASEEEAQSMAMRDEFSQMAQDYLAGAISGGAFGTAANVAGAAASTYHGAKAQSNNETDTILGKAANIQHEAVQSALDEYENNSSRSNLGKLKAVVEGYESAYGEVEALSAEETAAYLEDRSKYANIENNVNIENDANINNATAEEITADEETAVSDETAPTVKESDDTEANNTSVSSNPYINASIEATPESAARAVSDIRRAQSAQDLESAYRESQKIDNSQVRADAQTAYEIQSGRLQAEHKATADELNTWRTSMSAEEAYEAGYNDEEVDTAQMLPSAVTAYNRGAAEGEIARIKEQKAQYESIDNKNIEVNTQSGDTVQIDSFVQNGDKIGIQVKDAGETEVLTTEEVSTDNTQLETLINDAANLNTAYEANVYVANYASNMSPSMYNTAAQRLINAGEIGQSYDKALSTVGAYKGWMTDKAMRALYDMGAERAEGTSESNEIRTPERRGKGEVIDNRSVHEDDDLYNAASAIAKLTGIDIELNESGKNKKRGTFSFKNSLITINTDYDNTLRTLVHESLGELNEAYAPEEMEKFYSDFIDMMLEESPDFYRAVADAYREDYAKIEHGKSRLEAYKELCNDFIISLFDSDMDINEFVQAVAETQNQSFIDKMMEFFRIIVDALSEMTGVKFKNPTRKEELRAKLLKATTTAIENYQKGEGTGGETKHALKVIDIEKIQSEIEENKRTVLDMPKVTTISVNEFPVEDGDLYKQIENYFNSIGNKAVNPIFGDVLLNKRSIKDDRSHSKSSKLKIRTYKAVPAVIEKGKIVGYEKNYNGEQHDRISIVAPIYIQDESGKNHEYLTLVVVKRFHTNDTQRLYFHQATSIKKDELFFLGTTLPKEGTRRNSSSSYGLSILQEILEINKKDESLRDSLDIAYMNAVDSGDMGKAQEYVEQTARAAGYDSPLLHHGTQAFGFTEIDTNKSDDGISFFATNNPSIASSYSGVTGQRGITESRAITDDNIAEMAKETGLFKNVEDFPSGDKKIRYEYLKSQWERMGNFARKHEKEMRDKGLYEDYLNFSNALFDGVVFENVNDRDVARNLRKLLRPLKEAHYVISDYA
ncbi:MAG: hypothetical protein K5840_00090, partial [Eubacterium sp.]|nr:hypothetical protein [Eubacterium sp.]